MFKSPKNRCRIAASRTTRRLQKRWKPGSSRRLGLESLERREMLSASPSNVVELPAQLGRNDLPRGLAVGQAHTETHWINGELTTMVAEPALSESIGSTATTSMNGALHPLTSIPELHSNPGARATIYLDFNGNFEAQWGTYTNVTTPVYDIDGDLTTFSNAELANINLAWQTVAEDYAPFNIDVTTVEPPALAPGMPDSAANGVAVRVAIGGDNSWLGLGPGSSGYALVGSFTSSQTNTAYVFSRSISVDFIRAQEFIGDVASHEAAHTFGVLHQSSYDANGVKLEEYNSLDGYSAAIMGYFYTAPVATWCNGTSTSATTLQDDMAVIASSSNGFGYRPDDHGNTLATADPLAFDGQAWTGSGIIGTNSDVDDFSFTVTNSGTYQVNVDTAPTNPDLDSTLQLFNASGAR